MGMEAFNDTPMVNGVAYPYVNLDPQVYRFRILNGANDRFFNLQFYTADPDVVTSDLRINTEVKMVPAMATPGYPSTWSTDGRMGGVPDPYTAGPSWIQIGIRRWFPAGAGGDPTSADQLEHEPAGLQRGQRDRSLPAVRTCGTGRRAGGLLPVCRPDADHVQ